MQFRKTLWQYRKHTQTLIFCKTGAKIFDTFILSSFFLSINKIEPEESQEKLRIFPDSDNVCFFLFSCLPIQGVPEVQRTFKPDNSKVRNDRRMKFVSCIGFKIYLQQC